MAKITHKAASLYQTAFISDYASFVDDDSDRNE